jgi:hypothetical protein
VFLRLQYSAIIKKLRSDADTSLVAYGEGKNMEYPIFVAGIYLIVKI